MPDYRMETFSTQYVSISLSDFIYGLLKRPGAHSDMEKEESKMVLLWDSPPSLGSW